MIRVMVVEDEPLAQDELSRLIEKSGEFKVVSRAVSGTAALQQMKRSPVDVVFLDIEIPEKNGLEVASKISEEEKPPVVVFATAYDNYAVKAFESNAIDYVLKPYEAERLKRTFERVKEHLKDKQAAKERLTALDDDLVQKGLVRKIIGRRRNSKERIVIDPSQVFYFYAKLTEVQAQLETETLLVRSTLKELIENLNPAKFTQVHKAYLINLDKIEKVSPLFSGNFEIVLKDSEHSKIPLSRRFAKKLKKQLETW